MECKDSFYSFTELNRWDGELKFSIVNINENVTNIYTDTESGSQFLGNTFLKTVSYVPRGTLDCRRKVQIRKIPTIVHSERIYMD